MMLAACAASFILGGIVGVTAMALLAWGGEE
jgi:hypothetical protein